MVVPAHNEASVIGRLLTGLLADACLNEFNVVVVANGCSDDTARVAASFGPQVSVVSTPIASKAHALQLGDEHARGFPRLYVDADVELDTDDARALARALGEPGVLAAAPRRVHAFDGASAPVRWYYDVWERLPVVQSGLFGRGVIGVSAEGHRRMATMPRAMSDDLIASVAFSSSERRIAPDARVVVHPPRTVGSLVRTRVRAVTGTVELQRQLPDAVAEARTSAGDVLALLRRRPWLAVQVMTFLAVTVLVRTKARRTINAGDFTTWLRDDSSRAQMDPRPVTIPAQRGSEADVSTRESH